MRSFVRIDEQSLDFFASEATAIFGISRADDVVYPGRTNTQAVAVIKCGR